MRGGLDCGHDPLAVVWNDRDRRYDCQDCLLGYPSPPGWQPQAPGWPLGADEAAGGIQLPPAAEQAPTAVLESRPIVSEPDPLGDDALAEPVLPPRPKWPRPVLAPKRRELLAQERRSAPPAPPTRSLRRWVYPNSRALCYEYQDGGSGQWVAAIGTVIQVAAACELAHDERLGGPPSRELLTLWGRPLGPSWHWPLPFALLQRRPLDVLAALAAGTAVLTEREPLGRRR